MVDPVHLFLFQHEKIRLKDTVKCMKIQTEDTLHN